MSNTTRNRNFGQLSGRDVTGTLSSNFGHRWNISADGVRIGWVVKHDAIDRKLDPSLPGWSAYLADPDGSKGQVVSLTDTLAEAADELAWQVRNEFTFGCFVKSQAQVDADAERLAYLLAEMEAATR